MTAFSTPDDIIGSIKVSGQLNVIQMFPELESVTAHLTLQPPIQYGSRYPGEKIGLRWAGIEFTP